MDVIQPRWKTVAFWSLSILLGGMFLFAGGTKLVGTQMQVETFAALGLPGWFLTVVGLVELAGAVLLLVPATRFYGASAIVGTMVGAALTHVLTGVGLQGLPVVFAVLAMSVVLAWSHRPEFVRRVLPHKAAA